MQKAICVGFEQHQQRVIDVVCKGAQVLYFSGIEEALQVLDSSKSQLLLVNTSNNKLSPLELLEEILSQISGFKSKVVLLDSEQTEAKPTILEWDDIQKNYSSRVVSMEDLEQELEIFRSIGEIINIGFYNCMEVGGRKIHVQTEVVENETIQIRTTLIENGKLLDAVICNWDEDDRSLAEVRNASEAQHKLAVADVGQGKYS
jgi:hypothetical protein